MLWCQNPGILHAWPWLIGTQAYQSQQQSLFSYLYFLHTHAHKHRYCELCDMVLYCWNQPLVGTKGPKVHQEINAHAVTSPAAWA